VLGPVNDHGDPAQEALAAVVLEIERHVRPDGWDQSPRLFALVRTERLIAAQPDLADRLRPAQQPGGPDRVDGPEPGLWGTADRLTAVEQEHFESTADLVDDLARVSWPASVEGCAIAVERLFLPAGAEEDLPDDPRAAAQAVAAHPSRQEVRVVAGVDRLGHQHGVARVRTAPDELLGGADLVPGLSEVLAHTLA
jgi:hypothetical protein